MRRRKLGVDLSSYTLAVAGAIAFAWTEVSRDPSVEGFGRVALIIGVMLVCYSRLSRKGLASDEIYRTGFDLGFEAGCTHERSVQRPERPVVVPLRRCACQTDQQREAGAAGEPASVSAVASTADRG